MRDMNGLLCVEWYSGFEYIDLTHISQIIHSNKPVEFLTYEYMKEESGWTCYYSPKLHSDKQKNNKFFKFSLEYTSPGQYVNGVEGEGKLGTAYYFYEKDCWRCEWIALGSTKVTDDPECRILDPNIEREYRNAKQAIRCPCFRFQILSADNHRCVLSGEAQEEALDAAHIVEVRSKGFDNPDNGITLRKDLHALFDARLFDINSEGYVDDISNELSETYQKELLGKKIIPPNTLERVKEALKQRINENRNA